MHTDNNRHILYIYSMCTDTHTHTRRDNSHGCRFNLEKWWGHKLERESGGAGIQEFVIASPAIFEFHYEIFIDPAREMIFSALDPSLGSEHADTHLSSGRPAN